MDDTDGREPGRPVRVGLVGCGSNGQIHADGLAKLAGDGLVDPVVAADPDPAARAAANRNCAFGRLAADPAVVLADPSVEAVMVCHPHPDPRRGGGGGRGRRKAVLCEKPPGPPFAAVR